MGDRLVRFVYVDEAGVSRHEPVTTVAGVILHGDTQWRQAKTLLNLLRETLVPEKFRPGFIFHCKSLFGDPKKIYGEEWPLRARIDLIEQVLTIPGELSLGVAIGYSRKHPDAEARDPKHEVAMRHMVAFAQCVSCANAFIRDKAPGEIATLVAENTPEMNRFLSRIVGYLQSDVSHTDEGTPDPIRALGTVDVIIDAPLFVEKERAPLLQLADACAFAAKRSLAKLRGWESLATRLMGDTTAFDGEESIGGFMAFGFAPVSPYVASEKLPP